MRSIDHDYDLTLPTSLESVLTQLAEAPGRYTPMAGGTELMVAFNAGRLTARSLISIQHLRELRFIRVDDDTIHIGAGSTFTDIRQSETITRELPLLARAASWTGSLANQNRATLGGNLCNASPAADSPPVLLAYDATVTCMSTAGARDIPYSEFHLGYKRTALRPEELLYSVSVRRVFAGWRSYIRKVGTRQAQAISKVALAGVAQVDGDLLQHIRLGAASLADRPLRLLLTEGRLNGSSLSSLEETVRFGRATLFSEAKPIDDIRSTARYRSNVAANLLEEFLRQLASDGSSAVRSL